MQDAMAAAGIAGGDAGDFNRNDSRIEQCDHPAHRPHKPLRLAGAPIHILGPVNAQNFLWQFGGKQFRRCTARALDGRTGIFTLGVGNLFERIHSDAGLLRKGLRGRRGRAVFERGLPRGACELFFRIRLAVEHAFHQHRKPPRRGVRGDLGLAAEHAFAGEQIMDPLAQLGFGSGNHAGWDFIEPEFQ